VLQRFTARALHDLGVLSVAAWRAVLSVQDFSDRNDFIGVNPDHHSIYRGALYRHLSPAASPCRVHATPGRSDHRRRLADGLRHRPALPVTHQNVLLPGRSDAARTSSQRLAYLQHSDTLAVAHVLLLSGEFLHNRMKIR